MAIVVLQVKGQDEVKGFLSKDIQKQISTLFDHGQCRFKPDGDSWKDLLDTISELLAYQLQEVCHTELLYLLVCSKPISYMLSLCHDFMLPA